MPLRNRRVKELTVVKEGREEPLTEITEITGVTEVVISAVPVRHFRFQT